GGAKVSGRKAPADGAGACRTISSKTNPPMDSAEAASTASAADPERIFHSRRESPSAGQCAVVGDAPSGRFANAHKLERWLRRYSRDGGGGHHARLRVHRYYRSFQRLVDREWN